MRKAISKRMSTCLSENGRKNKWEYLEEEDEDDDNEIDSSLSKDLDYYSKKKNIIYY